MSSGEHCVCVCVRQRGRKVGRRVQLKPRAQLCVQKKALLCCYIHEPGRSIKTRAEKVPGTVWTSGRTPGTQQELHIPGSPDRSASGFGRRRKAANLSRLTGGQRKLLLHPANVVSLLIAWIKRQHI